MEPQRRRAPRLPPHERRRQLLDCAIKVFARRGLGRGGHAEVAREAGVAVATVFAYFRTREALRDAVLADVREFYTAMADHYQNSGRPAARALLEHARAFADSVDRYPDHARILLNWSTAVRADVWPKYLEFYEEMVARFSRTIRRAQAEGIVATALDVENTALILVGSAFMVVQMEFTRRPSATVDRFLLALMRAALGAEAVSAASA